MQQIALLEVVIKIEVKDNNVEQDQSFEKTPERWIL